MRKVGIGAEVKVSTEQKLEALKAENEKLKTENEALKAKNEAQQKK